MASKKTTAQGMLEHAGRANLVWISGAPYFGLDPAECVDRGHWSIDTADALRYYVEATKRPTRHAAYLSGMPA